MRMSSFFREFQTNVKLSKQPTRCHQSDSKNTFRQSIIDKLTRLDDNTEPSSNCPEQHHALSSPTKTSTKNGSPSQKASYQSQKAQGSCGASQLLPAKIHRFNLREGSNRSSPTSSRPKAVSSKQHLNLQVQAAYDKLSEIKEMYERRKSQKKEILSRGTRTPIKRQE